MRFLLIGLSAFLVGAIFPIAVFVTLPLPQAQRWVQNNLSFSIFLLTAYPVAVGVFAAREHPTPLACLAPWLRHGLRLLLTLLIVIAVLLAVDDLKSSFTDRILEPYNLVDFGHALSLETRLRQDVKNGRLKPEDARKQYLDAHLTFSSISDWLTRASFASKWAFVLNVLAGGFVALFFWYLILLLCWHFCGGATIPPAVLDSIFLIFGLLATWFPMRVYAEWYINFHSSKHLSSYSAFTVLIIVAIAVAILVVLLRTSGTAAKMFSALSAGFTGALGILGKLKPELVRRVAEFVEGLSPIAFVAVDLVVLIIFVMLALPWLARPAQKAAV